MTTRICALPSCGRTFDAERADARYCSPSCRGKASRERRKLCAPPSGPSVPLTPAAPAPPEPDDDFDSRVLSLEERLQNLEADLDLAETQQVRLIGMASRLDAMASRLPGRDKVQEWCQEAIHEEVAALRERLDKLEHAVGLDEEAAEDSLTERVAALEVLEPGNDEAARARIRRLEEHLARERNRGNALERQVELLAAGLRDLAGVVEERVGL